MDEVKQVVRQFILSSFLFTEDGSQLSDSDSLLERGIMDSTGVLQLITFVEETFHVSVLDEEMIPDNFDSVDRVVSFVAGKRSAAAG